MTLCSVLRLPLTSGLLEDSWALSPCLHSIYRIHISLWKTPLYIQERKWKVNLIDPKKHVKNHPTPDSFCAARTYCNPVALSETQQLRSPSAFSGLCPWERAALTLLIWGGPHSTLGRENQSQSGHFFSSQQLPTLLPPIPASGHHSTEPRLDIQYQTNGTAFLGAFPPSLPRSRSPLLPHL